MKKRFFLLLLLAIGCSLAEAKPIRLLYWNIQNGMWDDQPNHYDNFVKFVNEQHPDICVWCEAQSLYYDGTDTSYREWMERYLPSNWDELAARYGHSYVYLGGYRDSYPQVITSRYPIRNVKRLVGERPDSVVAHGAGWAQIDIKGKTYNIVTLHTWPQRFTFEAQNPTESAQKKEGDLYRRKELKYICDHTIATHPNAAQEYWMMMGDFNSKSPVDNFHYQWPSDTTAFYVHNYVREKTVYRDAVAEKHPGEFISSVCGDARIDFVYVTPKMLKCIRRADILNEGYPKNHKLPISNFCKPSDHLPILLEFK